MGPTFVLILQLGLSGQRATKGANLAAAAQASGRPRECTTEKSSAQHKGLANVWEAAREPNLERYCDLVARGFGLLASLPEAARETADLADRAAPGRAAPAVIRGRAFAGAKQWADAAREFERARSLDSRSLDDPLTMREWARALAATGRARDALAAYRTLGPRVSILPSPDERARTFVEGAELALSLGEDALDDALAFLGEAKQLAVRDLEWRVNSELALAFDRRGAQGASVAIASDLARRFRAAAKAGPTAEHPEMLAASALVMEIFDPRLAVSTWEKYLQQIGVHGAWTAHAQKHLETLRRKGRGG